MHDTLQSCARFLKAQCINTIGSISTVGSDIDRVSFRGPPPVTDMVLGETRLDSLAQSLYAAPELDPAEYSKRWRVLAAALTRNPSDTAGIIEWTREIMPALPMDKRADGRILLARTMIVASWQGYALECEPLEFVLHIDGTSLRLERGAVEWPGYRRRFPMALKPRLTDAGRVWMGRAKGVEIKPSAAYRFLCTTLPDLSSEIEYIFAAATHGRALDAIMYEFDVDEMAEPILKGPSGTWARVRSIIMKSETWPLRALTRELSRLYSAAEVWERFASNNVIHGPYSARMREKHLRIARELEAEQIAKVKGRPAESNHELLQLQEMIRG